MGHGLRSHCVWWREDIVAVGAKHRHPEGNHPHPLQQDNEAETMSGHVNVTR